MQARLRTGDLNIEHSTYCIQRPFGVNSAVKLLQVKFVQRKLRRAPECRPRGRRYWESLQSGVPSLSKPMESIASGPVARGNRRGRCVGAEDCINAGCSFFWYNRVLWQDAEKPLGTMSFRAKRGISLWKPRSDRGEIPRRPDLIGTPRNDRRGRFPSILLTALQPNSYGGRT